MAEVDERELDQALEELRQAASVDEETSEFMDVLVKLLSLPDENFEVLAPGMLQSYQQSLNNPNDRLALVKALNAEGATAEDLEASLMAIVDEVDKLEISAIKRDFLKDIIASIINTVNETEGIAKRIINVPIELCHPDAKIPQYAHESDSGMDVYALEDVTINPGETVLVPTGIKIALPPGYEIQVRPKSGRALKTKLRIANTPGTIDQGYRDEIKVIVENVEPPIKHIDYVFNEDGAIEIRSILEGSPFYISKGEKFCQLVLAEVPKATFYTVNSVMDIGENRNGGFGSTGLT